MTTVDVEQARPNADRSVEANAWLAELADLLALFRETTGRPPTDAEMRRAFAYLTETEVPR